MNDLSDLPQPRVHRFPTADSVDGILRDQGGVDNMSAESDSSGSMAQDDPNGDEDRSQSRPVRSGSPPPIQRRGSMSEMEQRQRRASIRAIMADTSIPPAERRRSIQFLMDGRRNSMGNGGTGVVRAQRIRNSGDEDMVPTPVVDPTTPEFKIPKHPYCATTTPVPAVAAQDASSFNLCSPCTVEQSKRAEQSRPPCEHYKRNCTIISPCCGTAFGCRLCHDECPVLPPPMKKENNERADTGGRRKFQRRSCSMPTSLATMNEPQHHSIDRFMIQEVICRKCYTRQSSKSNKCINCEIEFGEYHCAICNLWMSKEDQPYHCADCGFCRVGGAENFRHCRDCGMCVDASLFDRHNCKVGKYMCKCPVCQEDLFSSRSAGHEMPCGHAIHWHCFRELAAHDSRCPLCKKTAETHERMAPTWNAMATSIELQPVPAELAKVVSIYCNDCERRDEKRSWHFLGVQCRSCMSFNTVVEEIALVGIDAHNFLRVNNCAPAAFAEGAMTEDERPRRRSGGRTNGRSSSGGFAARVRNLRYQWNGNEQEMEE